jgi:glycogen synthase kinase 3 beta
LKKNQQIFDIKICDFGSAKVLDRSIRNLNTPFAVSRYYRAPELILGSNLYGPSIDVWATGVIMFELFTGMNMFTGVAEAMQLCEYAVILGRPTEVEIAKLKKIIKDLALKVLLNVTDTSKADLAVMLNKITPEYSKNDINAVVDLITNCLRWVPSDRISAENASNHPFFKAHTK